MSEKRKDLWIPACFVLFFVGLAGLEAWFVLLANRTFSGLVTDNAYAVGLKYDDVLAQREAERELGWSTNLNFVQQGGLVGRLTLAVTDRDGIPLDTPNVRATAERMTRFPQIQTVNFLRQKAGIYVADLKVPLAGRWFVRLRVEQAGRSVHAIKEVDVLP
ncbi:FixH family protein [Nordella sp. HKS 07]|uniref:FixH family protein n=1 Tax=Nordella sp. HKS 07 TaxID=2712222 RepID=UPI0013E10412|nr:FixH family protein [Nordella sp. HKS 07]QIG51968.1 FixH family protein [Nordella sp. HKS 07]